MRLSRAVVEVEEEDVLGDPINLVLAPEEDGRVNLVGEALALDSSFPIDASSVCKVVSADANTFFSF